MKKRILSVLLALSMTAALLAPAAAAEPSAEEGISLYSVSGGAVELASGNHEKWFDRIGPETDNYKTLANTFYAALEEAADGDGSADYLIQDTYFSAGATPIVTSLTSGSLTAGAFVNARFAVTGGTSSFTAIYFGSVPTSESAYARSLITAVYNAFDRDHPEVFWLDGASLIQTMTSGGNAYLFFVLANLSGTGNPDAVRVSGYTETEIMEGIENRDAYVAGIKNDIAGYSGLSNVKKVEAFDNWLTRHNQYNTSANLNNAPHEAGECLSALEGRTGGNGPICEGYARAFKVLCDDAGIPCVLVDGRAQNSQTSSGEDHMWNYVQLAAPGGGGNQWYAVDVTWDDPTGGNAGAVSGGENQDWLLVGGTTEVRGMPFLTSHPVSNTVSSDSNALAFTNGPELTDNAYYPDMTGTVSVSSSGNYEVGATLTASITGAPDSAAVTWRWYRYDEDTGSEELIAGAAGASYVLTVADIGKYVKACAVVEGYKGSAENTYTGPVGKKPGPAAPDNVTGGERTGDSITVTADLPADVSGELEYAIQEAGGTLPATGWQSSGTFRGLAGGTEYTVFIRVKETADTRAGTAVSVDVSTMKALTAGNFEIQTTTATYTGSGIDAGIVMRDGLVYGGEITISYRNEDGLVTTSHPVNAGTYDILVDAEEDGDWGAVTGLKVGTLTINRATTTITVPGSLTVTLGATESLGAALPSGATGTVTYTSENPGIASVNNAGSVTGRAVGGPVTITIAYAGNDNYEPATATVEVTVTDKLAVTVTFTASTATAVYNPEGYALGGQFTPATVPAELPSQTNARTTYQVKYPGEQNFGAEVYNTLDDLPKVTEAGAYTVRASYESDTHAGQAEASFTVTQAEQAPLTLAPDTAGIPFNGVQALSVTGGSGTGTVTYTVTPSGAATVDENGRLTARQVGEIKVTAVKAGDNNYRAVTSNEITITVVQADAPTVAPVSRDVLWNERPAPIPLTGGPSDQGTVTYGEPAVTNNGAKVIVSGASVSDDGELTVTLADGLTEEDGDAGLTATVTVTVNSANYRPYTITVNLQLTNKARQEDLFITSTSVTFPNTLRLTVRGGSTNGKVTYAVTGITGAATVNNDTGILTPTKAGTVSVVATKAGDETYRDVSSDETTITISKGTPQVRPTYTTVDTAGKTLADIKLGYTTSTAGLSGTISWSAAETTAVQPNASYQWVFTPDAANRDNYNSATGSVVLWYYSTSDSGSSDGDDTGSVTTSGGSTTVRPTTSTSDGAVTAAVTEELGQQLVGQAVRTGSDVVTIAPELKRDANDVKVDIPAKTVSDLSSRTDADLKVSTPVVNVTIPNGALAGLASRGDVIVSTSRDSGVISVEISAGGSRVSRVDGGVTVEVPASYPTSGTVAVLVNSNGSTTVIRKSLPSGNAIVVPLEGSAQIRITDNSKRFADVAFDNWAAGAVAFISSREIMNGTNTATFSPSESMTRGMLAVVLHNIENNPRAADLTRFPDVGSTWYTEAVQWAAGEGIVSGYSDGSFGPNDMVTREQLAVMLYRYAGQPAPSGYTRTFLDSDRVSSWAGDAIRWAVGEGILSGSEGRLNPGGQATRAEAASMLMRFMQSMG